MGYNSRWIKANFYFTVVMTERRNGHIHMYCFIIDLQRNQKDGI